MNVLVTGSNGFIGHHVAVYLKAAGHRVVGLGRRPEPFSREAVDAYLCCDLATEAAREVARRAGCRLDAVIHLAADMRREPHCVEVLAANCCGTQRLLETCEEAGIPVFLQLSSLPVIGHPVEHPITETHPLAPYTVYHITKRTEELLADYAAAHRGLRTASFRISAPLGPRMNPRTIFPTFVRQALAGEPLTLRGRGTRRQNYVHVRDIARCLACALAEEKVQGVYNLTGDLLLSNRELAEAVVRVLASPSPLVFAGEDPADGDVWDASLAKLRRDAGFIPETTIDIAIREYAHWLGTTESGDVS